MIDTLKSLCVKYKSLINYGVFGVLTTVINIVSYTVCYKYIGISNVASNIVAWVAACSFAFVTNKLWVFESKSIEIKVVIYELMAFFGCRLATGLLDLVIMYISVDLLTWNSTLMKCISNVIVIITNYIASKLVIFKKKSDS